MFTMGFVLKICFYCHVSSAMAIGIPMNHWGFSLCCSKLPKHTPCNLISQLRRRDSWCANSSLSIDIDNISIVYIYKCYFHIQLDMQSMQSFQAQTFNTKWQSKWWDKHLLALPQRLLICRSTLSLVPPGLYKHATKVEVWNFYTFST